MRKSFFGSIIICLVVMLTATQSIFAQFESDKKLPIDENVRVGKLSNGLTYYIRKNTLPAKKVQLRLVVNAGSVLEDADQQGLAHFMEHMNFNGLKHFPKNELVSYLQSIGVQFGADLNAYTSFDETVYILPIPSDDQAKVDKGFTILEDWAFNALLDTAEINKERGVVLEESRLGKGAGERMGKQFYPILFNGSDYAKRLPIGKDSILKTFKAESLKRFYKTWYRPDLMSVVVVGDMEPDQAEKMIKEHFGSYKNPVNPKPRPTIIPIAPHDKNISMVLTDKEQPYNIVQVFNFIERSKKVETWGDFRRRVIENLFNIIVNQRLNELTQQANPPYLAGSTSLSEFIRGYRSFLSLAVAGDKPVKEAMEAVISTTEAVRKFGFLESELQRAKTNLLTSTERGYNDRDKTESQRLVNDYVTNFLQGSPIIGISNQFAFVKSVLHTITLAEVNAVIKETETKQGYFALLMGSEKSKASLPSNEQLTAIINNAKSIPVKAYEEKVVATNLIKKAPTPGKITDQKTNTVLGTTDLTLSNGVTITIKPTNFKNDEIQFDSWRQGGHHNYPLVDKMNASKAAVITQTMGLSDMTPIELRKALTGKTASVSTYINPNDEGVEGQSSVKDVETMLQLVYLKFTAPRKDADLFQAYVKSMKSQLENMRSVPNAYFADTLAKVEYGNNPWANGLESAEDYNNLNLDRSMEIYKEIFGNAYGLHFTIVGNVDVEKIKPLLELYIGSLPAKPKENKFTDVGLRPVKGVVDFAVKKGAAKQSFLNLIFTGEAPYSKEEELKLAMLTEVLNIRVIEKLREEMSGIYGGGFGSNLSRRPYGSYVLSARIPCGPENVDKLSKALMGIITDSREKGISQTDLDKVKETLKKQNEDALKENDHWLSSLSYAFIESYDPAWVLYYETKVQSITVADLQDAAKKYFNMKNYIKAVLNPEN